MSALEQTLRKRSFMLRFGRLNENGLKLNDGADLETTTHISIGIQAIVITKIGIPCSIFTALSRRPNVDINGNFFSTDFCKAPVYTNAVIII